ncbi:hypothetical protein ACFX13_012105 [Malus domestica]
MGITELEAEMAEVNWWWRPPCSGCAHHVQQMGFGGVRQQSWCCGGSGDEDLGDLVVFLGCHRRKRLRLRVKYRSNCGARKRSRDMFWLSLCSFFYIPNSPPHTAEHLLIFPNFFSYASFIAFACLRGPGTSQSPFSCSRSPLLSLPCFGS